MIKIPIESMLNEEEDTFVLNGKTHYTEDFLLTYKNYNPETKVQTKVFQDDFSSVLIVKVDVFNDPVVTELSVMY
jgi:3'-phosphoadenosine 5'-phosphosulfate sulfotransferase